jgi:uncharacterized membrane protein YczE
MKNKKIFRFTMYIMGFVVLALGIISNTKSGLGVTPIISIPYVFSLVFKLNFGDAGLVKNIFDIGCVATTLLIGLLSSGHIVGVNVGTFAAMICVGRVIAIYDKFLLIKTNELSGIGDTTATEIAKVRNAS